MGHQPTNICSICLENINETPLRTVVALMPCGHIFHEDCHAGLRASVMEGEPDEDDDDDCLPEDRPVKCPSCKQTTNNFVRLFINLAGPSAVSAAAKLQQHGSRDTRRKVTMEDFIRNDLWSSSISIVQFAMRRIIHDFLQSETQAFLLLGGHMVIIRAMERFRTSHHIQFEGCRILRELVSKGHNAVLSDNAIFEMLLSIMLCHPKQEALISMICFILDHQFRYRVETKYSYREKVIQQSLFVMKRYPKEPHSKKLLVTVVRGSEEGLALLTHYEGIGIVINAMKVCAAQVEVQSTFCQLLGKLAASSAANKREVLLHDGAVVIAAALQRFHSLTSPAQGNSMEQQVQKNAESALQIICCPTSTTITTSTTNSTNNNSNVQNSSNEDNTNS
jgi:hypothetical protein